MLFFTSSLLTGVEASAAQKRPVTKTCLQCGAILGADVRTCQFCDSSLFAQISPAETASPPSAPQNFAPRQRHASFGAPIAPCMGTAADSGTEHNAAWQAELAHRMESYRARRRKTARNVGQAQFSFDDLAPTSARSVAVADQAEPRKDDFAFTVAIGRRQLSPEKHHGRMEIDVSIPPKLPAPAQAAAGGGFAERYGSYPVASLEERRFAALIDLVCLLFAYGGFLMLFGSLGGEFTISKLSAAVYTATLAIVYLQYFALFTIFGGTTPGMMFRGLQVTSFDGDPPQPRQMLLRSAGYVLSAGTFFLGFLWASWDEDALTWHDRLSRTYLSVAQTFANETPEAVHGHTR